MDMNLTDEQALRARRAKTRWLADVAECQKFANQHMIDMDEASDNLRRAQLAYDEMRELLWDSENELMRAINQGHDNGWIADNGAVIE